MTRRIPSHPFHRRRALRAVMTPLALAAALAGAGVLTLSHEASATPAAGTEEAREAQLIAAAPHSLAEAVRSAAATPGAKVFEAGLEERDGRFVYEIEARVGGETRRFAVDPQTGALTKAASPDLLDRVARVFSDDDGDGVAGVKTDMDAAIAAAEAETGGKAMEAQLESDDDDDDGASASGPIWAVRLAMPDGSIHLAAIDADTGATLASGADADHD